MNTTERFLMCLEGLVNAGVLPNVSAIENYVPSLYVQKITNMRKDKNKVTLDALSEFCVAFPNVNTEWLLTGKGEMFKEPFEGQGVTAIRPNTNNKTLEQILERCDKRDEQISTLIKVILDKVYGEKPKEQETQEGE